jgi:hypothetical protein
MSQIERGKAQIAPSRTLASSIRSDQRVNGGAQVADCGRPLRDFDSAYRTTMEFLENPQKLWFSNRLEDKRAVLKLAFESRIVYHRDTGYRTAVASIPFRIFNDLEENSDFESDDSEMVPEEGP